MTTALLPARNTTVVASSTGPLDLRLVQRAIFQATRATPRPVGNLMTWLLDRRNLTAAWDRVATADGADTPGPDGLTASQVRHRVGPWLAEIADQLYHKEYRPQAPRIVEIPKPDQPDRTRTIGILNLRDRVVQAALKQVLEPILDPIFLPTSFGFRPGRCVAAALDTACRGLSAHPGHRPKLLWAVPLDVADCFPTIDHTHLMKCITEHIGDADLLKLLQIIVSSGGVTVGRLWWQRIAGIVQGGSLSPLLCNLALHPLDLAITQLGHATQGGVAMLRYADDLLILARDASLGQRAVTTLCQSLHRQHQRFKVERSPVPVTQGVEWLGVTIRPRVLARPTATEFGYAVPDRKIQSMIARLEAMTTPPSDKIDAAAFNLGKWIVSINDQLRDWRAVYRFADNSTDVFRLLDDVARDRVGELLKAVTGNTWYDIRRNHRARLPRGYWTWEVPGARLSVLSSLAPQTPDRLMRKPDWWVEVPETNNKQEA